MYRLSDGLLASKLGLEFQVESDDASSQTSPRRAHRPHGQGSKSMPGVAGQTTLKQYRIKCAALMEKTIYTSKVEVHLGTSKQSSGLHLAGNFAVSLDGNHRVRAMFDLVYTCPCSYDWSLIFKWGLVLSQTRQFVMGLSRSRYLTIWQALCLVTANSHPSEVASCDQSRQAQINSDRFSRLSLN